MKRVFVVFLSLMMITEGISAARVGGEIKDAKSGEAIIGATVKLRDNGQIAAVSDLDGSFVLNIPDVEKYPVMLTVSYIGYKPSDVSVSKNGGMSVIIPLTPQDVIMNDVTVVGRLNTGSEAGILTSTRLSTSVTVGISAGQISKTPDSDAGEVIKRVPGISLIDGRYIIVRGLSQRYNNVWINGAVAPSSEADGRAFSFDIIPSGSIDNIVVAKSYSADLPGDFCGGFIKITSSGMPHKNTFKIGIASGLNTKTHFSDMRIGDPSCTDWLGGDNHKRALSSDFPANLKTVNTPDVITYYSRSGFNNDWSVRERRPLPDIKFDFDLTRCVGKRIGVTLAANYSNVNKTLPDITNNRYGLYNTSSDISVMEKNYTDN
ncbi:MAG: carboxypeptidase-like regulatory domain-containing protein, partial [Bacteroidales bacterium]